MIQDATFSRAELVSMTNVPDDVIAHWVKMGIIQPEQAAQGKGRHRSFHAREVNKVAIIARLREFRCSIDLLRFVSSVIDRAYALQKQYPSLNPYRFYVPASHFHTYREFVSGGPALVRDFEDGGFVNRRATSLEHITHLDSRDYSSEEMDAIHSIITSHYDSDIDRLALNVASDLSWESISSNLVRDIWLIWPNGVSWEIYSSSGEDLSGLRIMPEAAMFLHISRILKPLWGQEYVSSWDA
jgi:hypothetical protein